MFFLVALTLLASAFADPIPLKTQSRYPHGRIYGGEDASIETYPYQVALEMYGTLSCGGSIISAHYVLTAGHCVGNDGPAKDITIRAGSAISLEGGSVHQVVKVIRHEKYRENRYGVPVNDIAVLRVKEPFQFDETRQPINLFEESELANPGEVSVITGWGDTGYNMPEQLQTVSVPIVDQELCHKVYLKTFGGLPEGQICAAYYGVGGKDACQGDSGGPLAINGRLAGIVSWGNGCGAAYFPGVYTDVAYFRDWINKHVQF